MSCKLLKCTGCKERFDRENMITVPAGRFHNFDCAIQYANKKTEKRRVKEFKEETKRRKESAKTLRKLCSEAQIEVNRVRLRQDIIAGHKCISCGERAPENAGHRYHAGSKYAISWLRFLDSNINGQCIHCNKYVGGGNAEAYDIGFVERFGQAKFDELKEFKRRADAGEIDAPTREEIVTLKKEQAAEARRLLKIIKSEGLA